jgi:hypothetical protein
VLELRFAEGNRDVAMCLDRYLASAQGIAPGDRTVIESLSTMLKRLAGEYTRYTQKPWRQYWDEGGNSPAPLSDHVAHRNRIRMV